MRWNSRNCSSWTLAACRKPGRALQQSAERWEQTAELLSTQPMGFLHFPWSEWRRWCSSALYSILRHPFHFPQSICQVRSLFQPRRFIWGSNGSMTCQSFSGLSLALCCRAAAARCINAAEKPHRILLAAKLNTSAEWGCQKPAALTSWHDELPCTRFTARTFFCSCRRSKQHLTGWQPSNGV